MSNKISRRAFLKVTGVSALALGAASMLGGCQSSSGSVEVKVGDKVSNWNNLGVQLSSVFTLSDAPDVAGHRISPFWSRLSTAPRPTAWPSAHRTSRRSTPPIP